MNTKPLTKQKQGFTIIEVMIVLTIAGLILLIVFLAVPALQRNSRNTQRKNDISSILAAVNEYEGNNTGQLPSGVAWTSPNLSLTGGTSAEAKLGYYTGGIGTAQGDVQINTSATFPVAAIANNATNDRVVIVNKGACGSGGAVNSGSARQVAVQYLLESGSGSYTATCQDE